MAGTAKAVLQPDLSINIQYKDGVTQIAKVITIGEALQAAKSLGYNTILLKPTYWSYDCYTSIIAFNIPQMDELYLANSDLFTGGQLASAYLQKLPNWYGIYFGNIFYQNNSWYVRNTGQLANIFSRNASDSDIYYGETQVSDNTDYPIYLYTDANVGTLYINNIPQIDAIVATGGGATHIAKVTGLLSTLSSNLSDILMVSGGGGGGMLSGDTEYEGADAGGISGSGTLSGNQSTGYGFGQGEAGSNTSAGGGGLYGGYKGTSELGGGAGSGYIGNSLLSDKKMVGYNVPTSDVESTKTESTTLYSEGIMSDAAKMGDGGAKVTFLRELQWVSLESLVKNMDLSHIKRGHVSVNNLSEYFGTDWILVVDGWSQTTRTPWEQIGDKEYHLDAMYPYCELYTYFPLKRTYRIAGIRATVKIADGGSQTSTGALRTNMQSESFTLENQLLYNTKSTSPYGGIDSIITNDVYQTVEKLFAPVDCNYFQWFAVSGEYWNKDIELLVDGV